MLHAHGTFLRQRSSRLPASLRTSDRLTPSAGSDGAAARGRAIAVTLAGTWRAEVPWAGTVESPIDAHTAADIVPLLLVSGSAGLAWRRLQHSTLRRVPGVADLQQAYRLHALQSAIHDQALARVLQFLRVAGIEPILGKGWAIARLYPDAGLRPYGDVDLFVRREAYDAIYAAVRSPGAPSARTDLHRGMADLNDRPFDALQARSPLVLVGDVTVRVFGPEDHLRLLCLHMLRHGAWRPLWLVDVAVALESRPADFDWAYFLSGDTRRTEWAVSAIGLAHHLLGANVQGTPVEARARRLPRWLIPTVLEQWGRGQVPHGRRRPMPSYLRNPAGLLEALRTRWPNAVEATVGVHGAFDGWPRWPFQIGDCLRRASGFIAQLSR
jgi:Uncharacterised nucleotidyltransferase